MALLILSFHCLKVAFFAVARFIVGVFRAASRPEANLAQTRDKEFLEENGFIEEYDRHNVEEDRGIVSSWSEDRQPTTDILFRERRIGEAGVSPDLDDVEITTGWKPYFTKGEQTRLNVFALTPDLKHVAKKLRRMIARLRDRGKNGLDLSEELSRDKFSLPGRRFQTAVRSMIAGASMRGVPEDAACYVTIDIAATPPLPDWLHAGGAHPRMIMTNFDRELYEAQREVGCEHVYREGFLEVAKSSRIVLTNPYQGLFVKSYAKTSWPKKLRLEDHVDQISIVHIHAVMVLLDANGKPISPSAFEAALRRRFPASRAVMVEPLGNTYRTASMTLPEAAEAAIRYAMESRKNRSEDEMREQGRWYDKLKPEDIWSTGWTSYSDVRVMAVPILRASFLSRSKLREALVDIDIGKGWTIFRPRVRLVKTHAFTLVTPSAGRPRTPIAANDNCTHEAVHRFARDGPWLEAA